MNLAVWLARDAALHPDHVAVRHGEDVLTYGELSDRVARLAGFMRDRGLTAGERVGIIQWNGPRLLETLLAAFHGGFCVVPVNARATPYEAAQVLDDAEVGAVVYGPEMDGTDLLGAAGRAYTSVEVAVADAAGLIAPTGDGELVTRSDVVMKGYWRNPTATADSLRGGWLHTGDVGRIDSGGLVFLVDRSKDVIISGGANIYPREVEECILRHDEVRQAVSSARPTRPGVSAWWPCWSSSRAAIRSACNDNSTHCAASTSRTTSGPVATTG